MTTPASPTTGVQLLDVPPELAGQRIDNFLIARLKGAPKTLIYRILRKGEVRVNKGRIKPDYRLQAGDQVRVPPLRLAERDEPAPLAQGLLERMEAAIVPPELAGQRIDNFLIARLKGAPKTLIYRILRKGEVRVNKGRIKPDYRLQAGDQVRVPPLRLAERDEPAPLAQGLLERMEAAIVYEDKALIVVNKPAGIAVHGGSGVSAGVIEVFRQLRPDAKDIELVHRLDRDTSGLLMIAKKRSMLRHLHEALRGEKIVDKRYHALVRGHWPAGKKNVRAPLLKNNLRSGERMVEVNVEGKDALTEFRVLRRFGDFATLVEARPITGRTHQIRVHAKHAGHAIAGDPKYGDEDFSREIRELGGKRLFLHAAQLRVPLPDGQVLELEAPVDEMWQRSLERLND